MNRAAVVACSLSCLVASASARAEPPGKSEWDAFIAQPANRAAFDEFVAYLEGQKVAHVLEPSELLRQGTDWKALKAAPFVVPPKALWPNLVPVLRFVEKELGPELGALEVMSAYRTDQYNDPAGGARRSRHRNFEALDLQPKSDLSRKELHARLAALWKTRGEKHRLGLGLYSGTRFHVDLWRYRRW